MKAIITVREAIEELYKTFAKYPLPAYTDPCLHCHTLDDEAKLHSKPLRLLQWEDLKEYANDGLSVWGEEDTFKHLLPRLFDLFLYSDHPDVQYLDPEILFSKFRHGKWRSWPADEQNAVKQLLSAMWRSVLSDPPPESDVYGIDTWLCAIGQVEDDLSPYLQEWLKSDSLDLTLALLRLTVDPSGFSPFWEDRDAQLRQVKVWIASTDVTERIRDAEEGFQRSHDAAN
jgi:hypothetical protein